MRARSASAWRWRLGLGLLVCALTLVAAVPGFGVGVTPQQVSVDFAAGRVDDGLESSRNGEAAARERLPVPRGHDRQHGAVDCGREGERATDHQRDRRGGGGRRALRRRQLPRHDGKCRLRLPRRARHRLHEFRRRDRGDQHVERWNEWGRGRRVRSPRVAAVRAAPGRDVFARAELAGDGGEVHHLVRRQPGP